MKKALICGVYGQNRAYLFKLLLNLGYQVYGGSINAQMSSFLNLAKQSSGTSTFKRLRSSASLLIVI
ncbi:GDP-D-mannose dehydratase [Spirosoma sp. LMG 31448]|uniref:GDP-D-mannose dehydratase n=1 Tax=Spirosoma utsteinense TaxID=2585773 RepID=A0ABR6WAQ2_9BACT|nr:GDP-D-mannose dehydratase [Spirosoma utsteinense]MBC3793032.1 GDP-D-mannose dehydratase [Spirosoma utsteinense]